MSTTTRRPIITAGLRQRFLTKFVVLDEEQGGCWQWLPPLTSGYGRIYAGHKAAFPAHRISYELFVGPIASGLVVDHLCRNAACVNPDHLEAVPQRENVFRGVGPLAVNAAKTHCIHGHEFNAENTYLERYAGGTKRVCRTCKRNVNRRCRTRGAA